jgi:hypothetical protein
MLMKLSYIVCAAVAACLAAELADDGKYYYSLAFVIISLSAWMESNSEFEEVAA